MTLFKTISSFFIQEIIITKRTIIFIILATSIINYSIFFFLYSQKSALEELKASQVEILEEFRTLKKFRALQEEEFKQMHSAPVTNSRPGKGF